MPRIIKCPVCGKEFERFSNRKYCSIDCREKHKKEYNKKYFEDHYTHVGRKEKKVKPPKPVKREIKQAKPIEKKKDKLIDYIGNYEAEKNNHEVAEKTLQEVKLIPHPEKTTIIISELHNSVYEVNRVMTEEEIDQFKLEKIKQEQDKWEQLKKGR